jgi:glucosamine kinase
MSVFVGLDCGGSSSRVLAVDAEGTVLFQGQSGAANLASTPEPRLRKNLQHATQGCPNATFVCGCFAGLVSDEVRLRGEHFLRQLFPEAQVRAEPDYSAAFYASPEPTDVCVIAGTGSLVCSRGAGGAIVKSGGRGYILGDYGSAYHFGRDALLSFLDDPDSASTQLRDAVQELFHTLDEGAIVSSIYRAATPAALLGRLAKALGQDARDGRAYALESLDRNLAMLAGVVQRHVERHLANDTVRISLTGGLWKGTPVFREAFSRLLVDALPVRQVEVIRSTRPPLYGAVELAKEMSFVN